MYSSSMDSTLILSLCPCVDVYCPPRKKFRTTAPFVFGEEAAQKKQVLIDDVLPDECLFEIFRRLPSGRERGDCACVSKRWLFLLSSIRRLEICDEKTAVKEFKPEEIPKGNPDIEAAEDEDTVDEQLKRCLEGEKATDTRLAAIAVATSALGGLEKFAIRGVNSVKRVTKVGLSAIGRSCPSLKVLSLWNVSLVGDEGLSEIAEGCPLLQELELSKCALISDKGIMAIAENCPGLTSLSLESCPRIGNASLQAIAHCCPNLRSITISDCPLVGDQGIASLVSSPSILTNIKLERMLNLSDLSLAVIGHYGKMVTDLTLIGLNNTSEKGFWVMGNGIGLQNLKYLKIVSCHGVTDLGLEAVGKGCPNLKLLDLKNCLTLSDEGLKAFTRATISLEALHFEKCHSITLGGVLGALSNRSLKLKELSLVKCFGIRDACSLFPPLSPCVSLRSLSVRHCPGFGDAGMAMAGMFFPELQYLDFEGTCRATDAGFLAAQRL